MFTGWLSPRKSVRDGLPCEMSISWERKPSWEQPLSAIHASDALLRRHIEQLEAHKKLQSVSFLFVGAISGFVGFAFASYLGITKFKADKVERSFLGDVYSSGKNYHAVSVSEMVHNAASEEGKCFATFGLIAAICVLFSAYPWCLSNVYVGDDLVLQIPPLRRPWQIFTRTNEKHGVALLLFRQFSPPVGIMMVCGVTIYQGTRTYTQAVAAGVHNLGATMLFPVYIAFEIHALWLSPVVRFSKDLPFTWLPEKLLRQMIIVICAVLALGFEVFGDFVIPDCHPDYSCKDGVTFWETCTDQWEIPTLENIAYIRGHERYGALAIAGEAYENNSTLLLNTATGWVLVAKQATFWFEVFAGLALLLSHIAIWWCAPERPHAFAEEVLDITRLENELATPLALRGGCMRMDCVVERATW